MRSIRRLPTRPRDRAGFPATLELSRRTFLQSTALALAMKPLLAAEPPRKITVGFLGASHSHALEKLKVVRERTDIDFVGVCEESASVRASFAQLNVPFVARDELFTRAELVIVESAVRDHACDALLALSAGKHVHLEKPPAATMREFEAVVQLARERRRLVQVGYMWRFNPGFQRAFVAAREGWLGEVYLVRATMNTQLAPARRPEWAEFKGGAMFEQGCHLIDAVVRLLGRPTKVTPHLQRRGGDDLADNCVAVLEFPKAQAIVTNSVLQPNAGPHRFLEILGTQGSARVQPIEPPGLVFDLAKAAGPYPAGRHTMDLPAYRRYVGEMEELATAIREGHALSVSLDEELAVQETVLRASEMFSA